MKRIPFLAASLVLLAAAALILNSFRGAISRPADVPRLAVLIVIDQLRPDFLTRFDHLYKGGFRTLIDGGAYFTNAAYRHSSTFTAAGHATVSTGLHPSTHGMIANSWYDAAEGGVVNCIADSRYGTVGGEGRRASPLPLLSDTIGDRLKQKYSDSKVYSISSKDRAALLSAGRGADGAFWYSNECGCFVTSDYFENPFPEWLSAFNQTDPTARYAGRTWQRLLPDAALYEELARRDDFPTEAQEGRTTFPHQMPSEKVRRSLNGTPYADDLTLRGALAALESGELGNDDAPDLLAISFSGTDYVGHSFGPYSQEAMDQNLRLDGYLGELLERLDSQVGLDRVIIGLTADHGVLPLVEDLEERGVEATRLDSAKFWQRATAALITKFPKLSECIAATGDDHLYWDLTALGASGVDRRDAEDFLTGWLRSQPHVEAVYTASQLAARAASGEAHTGSEIDQLYANAFYEPRSPHLMVRFNENVFPGKARGTSHGSSHGYDREVPILLYGSDIRQGRFSQKAGPEDIAPTLARILKINTPIEPDSRVLDEALR